MANSLSDFRQSFKKLLIEKQRVQFLTSCVSQGLIPKGFGVDVNEEELVDKIQNEGYHHLDHILAEKIKRLSEIEIEYKDLCRQIKHQYSHEEILNTKKEVLEEARDVIVNFNKTVADLKKEKDNIFERCLSSQKMDGQQCINAKNNGYDAGDHLPNNLRQSRRNHSQRNNPTQKFQIYEFTAEYLSVRDPLILTENYVNFMEYYKLEGNIYAKPPWYPDTGQHKK